MELTAQMLAQGNNAFKLHAQKNFIKYNNSNVVQNAQLVPTWSKNKLESPRGPIPEVTEATSFLDRQMGSMQHMTTNPPSLGMLSPRTNNDNMQSQSPNGQSFISFKVQSSAK